jgi:hypothetical protein
MPAAVFTPRQRPWQGVVLAWLSAVDTAFWTGVLLFLLKLTREMFAAGEMGIMVGIFGAVGLLFLTPWTGLKAAITVGIFLRGRWALWAALILTCIGAPAAVFSLAVHPVLFAGLMLLLGLMLWAEASCIKGLFAGNDCF